MKQFRGALKLLTITALIWGTAFVAQSLGMDHLGPFAFNGVRNFIAALALLPVLLFMQRKAPKKTQTDEERKQSRKTLVGGRRAVRLGDLPWPPNLSAVRHQLYDSGRRPDFCTALYIVIVPILGLFLQKTRRPLTVWVSVVIAAAGTYLLSVQEGFTIAPGDLLVILCALGFSVHILIIDRFSPMVNGVALSCVQFIVCGILCTAAALFTETFTLADILKSAGPLLFTGLMSSGVGYTLQILGQKDTPPAVASLIMSLESVFAALSGWLVLGQSMNGRELLGCVLVFAAVILAQIPLETLEKEKAVKKTA